jgi:hypothetical protein
MRISSLAQNNDSVNDLDDIFPFDEVLQSLAIEVRGALLFFLILFIFFAFSVCVLRPLVVACSIALCPTFARHTFTAAYPAVRGPADRHGRAPFASKCQQRRCT